MLDRDLAVLYDVTTGNLNKAVKRNRARFPEDFMFQLTKEEGLTLSSFQNGILKRGQNIKYLPYVFTEQGVAMLSSVLNSERAVMVNIQIMRAFVRIRNLVADNTDVRKAIANMEKRLDVHDRQIQIAFDAPFRCGLKTGVKTLGTACQLKGTGKAYHSGLDEKLVVN